jgi:uncharacterized protein (TIGR02147 family)
MKLTRQEGENCESVLREALERRLRSNANYSQRAFARDLGISPETLSAFFGKRRGLSRTLALRIATNLRLQPADCSYFCDLVESQYGRTSSSRREAQGRLAEARNFGRHAVDTESFEAIANWEHFAILELAATQNFCSDLSAIAQRLSLTETRVETAVRRLERMGLIRSNDEGQWQSIAPFVAGPDGIPSEAVRLYQSQILEKALWALKNQPLETRDVSTVLMAFDSSQLEIAREKIREFRRNLSRQMPLPRSTDALYCLNINFFRLDTAES